MSKRDLALADNLTALLVYGDLNKNLAVIEEGAGVTIQVRGSQLTVNGPKHGVELAVSAINKLEELIRAGYPVYPSDVAYALRILQASPKANLKEIFLDKVYITAEQKVVSPKSLNQKLYIDSIRTHDIVFGIGPAGTGKTYLAVAMAVSAFVSKQVSSIILARPAVEAGERLGFLPGDMAQKVNPYLRPLHDALNDMLGRGKVADLIEEGSIEIAPLAFMRGRTLSNAFVILDEAQNTTHEQMKMFLTRLGFNSQAVITGDITQIDLPDRRHSGLIEAARILQDIKGIAFNQFSEVDVVRHHLVQKIIRAYADKETLPPPRRTTAGKH
ncbi:MAG: phosphate starvation-inducible protein PhoH [Deltaproteobacteria bacterium RIFOXYD12_FULL_56_24]|nr:MAG: phosphate starvation-inducible protein PhoH [Deltaproteobacteria bacterium RIFOXYD12_FULL_56_24]